MSKVAIVYWSGTGNTETMANAIASEAKSKGAEVSLFTSDAFSGKDLNDYAALAFGCPAMGAEVLEEGEFQPMWDGIKNKLSGKNIALFGSYGWGDGQWMRDWEERITKCGGVLVEDSIISNGEPTDEEIEKLSNLGRKYSV